MTKLLLVLLILAEAGFAVFSLIRNITKKDWQLGRTIINASQLVLFLVFLLFPGIDMSFRFKMLFGLLVCRALFSCIKYFIKKNKFTGNKSKALIVVRALLSILIILGAFTPALLFTDYAGRPTTGSHEVSTVNAILVDSSRVESFETDGSDREVPVYFYYPSDIGSFKDHELPLVIFSHGAFGYYQSNTSTYMELASNGYVVVSLDHPYHSFFTEDTEGKTVTVDPDFISSVMNANSDTMTEEEIYENSQVWLKLRVGDMNFVLDSIENACSSGKLDKAWFASDSDKDIILSVLGKTDTGEIGLMGHSLGGITSVEVGRERDDIDAVIDLDGTMLGEITGVENGVDIIRTEPYHLPLLNIENEEHHLSRLECAEKGIPYPNGVLLENAECAYNVYFIGAGHMNFTDLPLFAPSLASMLGTGTIDPERCVDTTNQLVLEFFDCYLKQEKTFTPEECYQ